MHNIIFKETISIMVTISSLASVVLSIMNYRDKIWNLSISVLFTLIIFIMGKIIIYFI